MLSLFEQLRNPYQIFRTRTCVTRKFLHLMQRVNIKSFMICLFSFMLLESKKFQIIELWQNNNTAFISVYTDPRMKAFFLVILDAKMMSHKHRTISLHQKKKKPTWFFSCESKSAIHWVLQGGYPKRMKNKPVFQKYPLRYFELASITTKYVQVYYSYLLL